MQEINSTISSFFYINDSYIIEYIKKIYENDLAKKNILVAYFIRVAFWDTNIQSKKEKRVDNDI